VLCTLAASKETKIGFVDANRIMSEYQATSTASADFNEFVNTFRDSAATLKRQIEELQSESETQKLVLSEQALLRKKDEIDALTRAYNQFLQEIFGTDGRVEQKNDELMAPLLSKINDAIALVAEREGFQIILELSEGVYYAASEFDMTDLVINELNLEYGPTTLPAAELKQSIVIFPFKEENPEAVNAGLGQRCQDELYRAIGVFSNRFDITNKTTVNMEIIRRGLGVNVIDDNQAYDIGTALLCDYIVTGRVSKISTKIDYTISLRDAKERTEITRRSSSVTEEVKLYEALNNDLRGLLEEIQESP
jgi:outer membrane protein